MNLLPFDHLPAYRRRSFVPQIIDLGDWRQIAPLFDQLEKKAHGCRTVGDSKQWLLESGELSAALDEEGSLRYIAMTCHTDNPRRKRLTCTSSSRSSRRSSRGSSSWRRFISSIRCARKLPQGAIHCFRQKHAIAGANCSGRKMSPLETEEAKLSPAVSETQRFADGAVSRPGADAGADGPLSWRNRTGPCARRRGN